MRQILILSVAMLLVLALADAGALSGSQGSPEDSSSEEKKEVNPTKTEGANSGGDKEADGECGKPKGDDMIVLQWNEMVDAKTAKTIQNVIKKGKGKATGGKANKIGNVRIIIEAKVGQNNANGLIDDLVKQQRTCDAKSSTTSDAKASGGTAKEGQRSNDDDQNEKEGKNNGSDNEDSSLASGDKGE